MSSFELTFGATPSDYDRVTGKFLKGHKPWNEGKTWKQMGIGKRKQKKMLANLDKGRVGNPNLPGWNKRPVIAIYPDGRFQYYPSSEKAGRVLKIWARNIRLVCEKKRKHCGGLRWFYENDDEWLKLVK